MTACEGLIPSDCNNPDCPAHAADRDDLAAILRGHQRLSAGWFGGFWCARCSCGEDIKAPDADDRQGWDGHREHLAQVVAESDWLRERDAAKWDEGYNRRSGTPDCRIPGNPYRADRVDAEDGGR